MFDDLVVDVNYNLLSQNLQDGLAASAGMTRVLLAVDQSDPTGHNRYFNDNLDRLRRLGLQVETFRLNSGI